MGERTRTVLIAEDEQPLADMYAEYLTTDYDVRVAYDGTEAIEALDADVDVALLDRRMPGKSGDEVLAYVIDREYDVAAAMVTAIDPDLDIIGMGFDDYICKPIGEGELQELVERLLDRREYDATVRELVASQTQRSLLLEELDDEELADSEEFAALEGRIERLKAQAEELLAGMDRADVDSLFRSLDDDTGDDLAETPASDG